MPSRSQRHLINRDGYDSSGRSTAVLGTAIANQSGTDSVAITPLDVSGNFTGATVYGASLPVGLSIDSATGIISGTPTPGAGVYNCAVSGQNGDTPPVTHTFTWTLS